jgi:hypothetical protein
MKYVGTVQGTTVLIKLINYRYVLNKILYDNNLNNYLSLSRNRLTVRKQGWRLKSTINNIFPYNLSISSNLIDKCKKSSTINNEYYNRLPSLNYGNLGLIYTLLKLLTIQNVNLFCFLKY